MAIGSWGLSRVRTVAFSVMGYAVVTDAFNAVKTIVRESESFSAKSGNDYYAEISGGKYVITRMGRLAYDFTSADLCAKKSCSIATRVHAS